MPILLKSIRVAGFRGLKNIEINLNQNTVLIGTNNVGKTTFLNALQVAFGDSRWVSPDDFSISAGSVSTQIVVDLQFVPVDSAGKTVTVFDELWIPVFRKGIQLGEDGQFFAFRSKVRSDEKQMRLAPVRKTLKEWLDWDNSEGWTDETLEDDNLSISSLSDHIPFFFQNAQRDILDDIKQRTSFLGRALSKVHYNESDRIGLQELIQEVNDQAVHNSPVLKNLKENLADLGNTFGTTKGNADITPFAKDIRDLTKGIRLHFADGIENFSMEYHGMGTRSWASLLTLKAFVNILTAEATEAYYPILALEEPEAHLHPNAQKQIMGQIKSFPGQVIVSTHSPYVASQATLNGIRSLYKGSGRVLVGMIPEDLDAESERQIQRQIIQTHGDLLFARAWVLFEGETEAQAFPLFFMDFFGREAWDLGVNLIGVAGAGNFAPFIRLAQALNIPWYIFTDGEADVLKSLTKMLTKYAGLAGELADCTRVFAIPDGLDYEGYLLKEGYLSECISGIESVESTGYVQKQILKKNGTKGRAEKTDIICDKCTQFIFDGPIHDYSGSNGVDKFIADLLEISQAKTKYAGPIAIEILKQDEPRNIPSKLKELFVRMKVDLFPQGDV